MIDLANRMRTAEAVGAVHPPAVVDELGTAMEHFFSRYTLLD
jgi:hypothetical protein